MDTTQENPTDSDDVHICVQNHHQKLIRDYIAARSPEYCRLEDLRKQGWQSSTCESFFKAERARTETPDVKYFFKMTKNVGTDLHRQNAFSALAKSTEPTALDLGMAPGGFSAAMLELFPETKVRAITLAEAQGGYVTTLQHKNLKLDYRDINSLAGDMGFTEISGTTCVSTSLTLDKILGTDMYDVVICGCQALPGHKIGDTPRNYYASRLQLAQLIIAMRHLKDNGTIILLLHKPERLETAEVLQAFSSFSSVLLFKPKKIHGKRSSFYMLAKKVQTCSENATQVTERWMEEWRAATLGTRIELAKTRSRSSEQVEKMLEDYGENLVKMANPVWAIQANALAGAPFNKWR